MTITTLRQRLLSGAKLFIFDRDDTLFDNRFELLLPDAVIPILKTIHKHHVWGINTKGAVSRDAFREEPLNQKLQAHGIHGVPELYTQSPTHSLMNALMPNLQAQLDLSKESDQQKLQQLNVILSKIKSIYELQNKLKPLAADAPELHQIHKYVDEDIRDLRSSLKALITLDDQFLNKNLVIGVGEYSLHFKLNHLVQYDAATETVTFTGQKLWSVLGSRKPLGVLECLNNLEVIVDFSNLSLDGAAIHVSEQASQWPTIQIKQIVAIDDDADQCEAYKNFAINCIQADSNESSPHLYITKMAAQAITNAEVNATLRREQVSYQYGIQIPDSCSGNTVNQFLGPLRKIAEQHAARKISLEAAQQEAFNSISLLFNDNGSLPSAENTCYLYELMMTDPKINFLHAKEPSYVTALFQSSPDYHVYSSKIWYDLASLMQEAALSKTNETNKDFISQSELMKYNTKTQQQGHAVAPNCQISLDQIAETNRVQFQ